MRFATMLPVGLVVAVLGCGSHLPALPTSQTVDHASNPIETAPMTLADEQAAIAAIEEAALLENTVKVAIDGTGSIKGQFVLKGEKPTLPEPRVDKDPQVCAAQPVPNETLIVDEQTKGVKNVFIWVIRIDENAIPEALREPEEDHVVLDQVNCVFIPHSFVVRAGQNLRMLNGDPVAHNVRATFLRNPSFNDTVAPNDREGIERKLTRAESQPFPVQCDIHPWMQAHMLVIDHPYAAVSNEKGEFTIEGLPPGKYDFKIWHEAGGNIFGPRGVPGEIKAGEATDLGTLEIDVARLRNLRR